MSVTKGIVKKGDYFDSISLMIISKKIREMEGVIDSAVVMGSAENLLILKAAGLYIEDFANVSDSDLLLVLLGRDEEIASKRLNEAEELLLQSKKKRGTLSSEKNGSFAVTSLESAYKIMPSANLVVISTAGKFAYSQAFSALTVGQNVMLFSDNITIEEELKLKLLAQKRQLLVMGPDCGTAIIGGVPLAFANSVRLGKIGVVGASGTGMQEVTSLIHNMGGGISHALGTGGRDIKEKIGGISFLQAFEMLEQDENTKVILLVAKPPHQTVLEEIGKKVASCKYPVVAVFLGATKEIVEKHHMIYGKTLEEGALLACRLVDPRAQLECNNDVTSIKNVTSGDKYIRALYSGGTFCYETQLILQEAGISSLYSNTPASGIATLANSNISQGNCIVDLGEDEFTKGRPHPMIDFSLRNRRILEEIARPDTALIILDLVIGHGANLDPQREFIPTVVKAKKLAPHIPIICFVTGTDSDPQNRQELIKMLKESGVVVVFTNAQAAHLATKIIRGI